MEILLDTALGKVIDVAGISGHNEVFVVDTRWFTVKQYASTESICRGVLLEVGSRVYVLDVLPLGEDIMISLRGHDINDLALIELHHGSQPFLLASSSFPYGLTPSVRFTDADTIRGWLHSKGITDDGGLR